MRVEIVLYQAKHIVKSLRFRLNHPLLHKHIDNIINDANNRLNATVHGEHSAILISLVPFIQTSLSDIQQTLLYKRIERKHLWSHSARQCIREPNVRKSLDILVLTET